jgi:hypothetical protein
MSAYSPFFFPFYFSQFPCSAPTIPYSVLPQTKWSPAPLTARLSTGPHRAHLSPPARGPVGAHRARRSPPISVHGHRRPPSTFVRGSFRLLPTPPSSTSVPTPPVPPYSLLRLFGFLNSLLVHQSNMLSVSGGLKFKPRTMNYLIYSK